MDRIYLWHHVCPLSHCGCTSLFKFEVGCVLFAMTMVAWQCEWCLFPQMTCCYWYICSSANKEAQNIVYPRLLYSTKPTSSNHRNTWRWQGLSLLQSRCCREKSAKFQSTYMIRTLAYQPAAGGSSQPNECCCPPPHQPNKVTWHVASHLQWRAARVGWIWYILHLKN